MTAHYFATKSYKVLIISRTSSLKDDDVVMRLPVSGKIEARSLAAYHGAKPWNF